MSNIRISCKGADALPLDAITEFQKITKEIIRQWFENAVK